MISNSTQLIDDLQKINAGLLNELTENLVYAISHTKLHYQMPANRTCTICNIDLYLEHHIKSYSARRYRNNDEEYYDGVIGIIWICPNCHYRIHHSNPYFNKTNKEYLLDFRRRK